MTSWNQAFEKANRIAYELHCEMDAAKIMKRCALAQYCYRNDNSHGTKLQIRIGIKRRLRIAKQLRAKVRALYAAKVSAEAEYQLLLNA